MRLGILGAARIVGGALVGPATRVPGVTVAAIAARDPIRAVAAAKRYGIQRVHRSYDELLADDSLDAIYIPLPAALHGHWTYAALDAGRHVLVEKPFMANADEAESVARAAARAGLVVMEAHHTAHHPFTSRLGKIVESGILGEIEAAHATFSVPIPPSRDIRWNFGLGGGGLMDLGCYPLRMLQDILRIQPDVIAAEAKSKGDIDRSVTAHLQYGTAQATVTSSMWSRNLFSARVNLLGTRAKLRVSWPYHPQQGGRLRIEGPTIRERESADKRSSYDYQLEAFRDAVEQGGPNITDAAAGIATMQTIDDIYRAAGMRIREPAPLGNRA